MKKPKRKIVTILLVVILASCLVLVFTSPLSYARERVRRMSCGSNLRSIGLAFKQYAMEYAGQFPDRDGAEGLEQLRTLDYLTDQNIYICPSSVTKPSRDARLEESHVAYVYRGGLSVNDSADSAIMWDKPRNHQDYGNILFVNGHVKGYAGVDWMANIR